MRTFNTVIRKTYLVPLTTLILTWVGLDRTATRSKVDFVIYNPEQLGGKMELIERIRYGTYPSGCDLHKMWISIENVSRFTSTCNTDSHPLSNQRKRNSVVSSMRFSHILETQNSMNHGSCFKHAVQVN